jgi:hypothetical protein
MAISDDQQLTLNWANATLGAFAFFAEGQNQKAAQAWIDANSLLVDGRHCIAIAAVASSNLATGKILLRRFAEACDAFRVSDQAWRALAREIETHDLPIAPTSSSFHFRLAASDTNTFMRLRRRRYARLCEAGWKIDRFNSLQAEPAPSPALLAARSRELRNSLRSTFGTAYAEASLLAETNQGSAIAGSSLYGEKARACSGSIEAERQSIPFWPRLESAVKLVALLLPNCIGAETPSEKTEAEASEDQACSPPGSQTLHDTRSFRSR